MMNQPSGNLSTKELAYITDSMKNEELLTKLCVQGASQCQDQQLKSMLTGMAEERVRQFDELYRTLQQAQ